MAAHLFEVYIDMPQHEISVDGCLCDQQVWQRDGHPLPSEGVTHTGRCFSDPLGERDLGQDT